jgi:dCMP deaminase
VRLSWDDYFVNLARAVALRADCTRRQVGAVLVSPDHRVLATGYNGAPPGEPGCLEGACPRGRHFPAFNGEPTYGETFADGCGCGADLPCPESSATGSSYTNCTSLHSEENALLIAGRSQCQGATLYVTDAPCDWCAKLIRGAGITQVIYPGSTV